MTTRTDAVLAAEIEADLDHYPDQRGEILLEAAHHWHRAGNHDHAVELLTQVIELGGEDGGYARVSLAEVLFDLDRADDAWAQLEGLRRERTDSPGPYHLAGELMEGRGDYQQALTWFNMAVSRLTDREMTELDTDTGWLSYANNIVAGRLRVRQSLGLPADQLDDSVRVAADFADQLVRTHTPPPRQMRVLFWPRGEIPRAHRTWPHLVETLDADTFAADREKANRELAEGGISRITMVPLTVDELIDYAARTGSDPTDSETRLACIDEIVDEGRAITWPPARNAPCWCGSTTKYKKCCGRPAV